MAYGFTTIMDRRGKDALAVDCIGADVLFTVGATECGGGQEKGSTT